MSRDTAGRIIVAISKYSNVDIAKEQRRNEIPTFDPEHWAEAWICQHRA